MKKLIISFIIILSGVSLIAQPGFEWTQTCGHPYYGETKSILEADGEGNIFMAGNFIETATFGVESITSAGNTDIFIAKYNSAGELMWLLGDGDVDYDYLHGIAAYNNGFYTGGSFYGTTHIGSETLVSQGSKDLFIAHYNQIGEVQWVKQIGSPKTDYLNALDADPFGNLLITGHYYDSIAFGDTTIYALGGSDIFLAKYNTDGDLVWLQQASGSSADQSYSLSCDAEGNLVFTGSFFSDISIGDTNLTTEDPTGVFFAKYNNNGELSFVHQVDGNGLQANSLGAFDAQGNIFFVGNFTDQVRFGPHIFEAGAFNIDIYITRFNPDGALQWADHGHSPGSDALISIATGPFNDLYLSGHFLDTIHFSDLSLKYTLCCGSAEIFMVRYTEDGTPVWGDQISGERAMAESLCKNAFDELFISGLFEGDLTFGGSIINSGADYANFLSGIATDTYTEIAEIQVKKDFIIYPIPAENILNIRLDQRPPSYQFEIFDMTGRRLLQGKQAEGQSIDISVLHSGQFLIRIFENSTGINQSTVFIKR